jgi:hypothetical protein
LRAQRADEFLDIPLRFVRRRCDYAVDILNREVRGDERDGRQVQGTTRDRLEEDREFPRSACGFDSAVSCMLRQVQYLRAVGEQRRATLAEIQPPRIYLREVRDELHRRLPFVRGQSLHVLDQLDIRQRRGHSENISLHTPF